MKLYKYIVAGLFGAVLVSSCTDLEEHPYTFIDPASYYQTEDELNSGLNSVYNAYRSLSNDGGTFMRLEGCTDFGQPNREGNKNNINDINAWKYQNQENNAGTFTSVWSKALTCINRANNVIAQVEAANMDETLKARAIGQAKFLRGCSYYWIVRIYGGAPIIKDVTKDLNNLSFPRNTADEVYDFIVEDWEYAEANLPERGAANYDIWRATKGAAQAYLGDLYLYRASLAGNDGYKTFDKTLLQKAAEYDLKVINSGKYSLMPDFTELWCSLNPKGAKNNAESIYELQFSYISGHGNGMHQNFGMFADSCYPLEIVSGGTTIKLEGGSYYYLRTAPSVEAWQSYDPADDRLKVLITEGKYKKGTDTVYVKYHPEDLGSLRGREGWGSCCPGNIKVHDFSKEALANLRSGNNFMMKRYAQVLLDYAEIQNALGNTAEALRYLNMVHQRAGLPAVTAASALALYQNDPTGRADVSSEQDAVDEAIFMERGWEFIGEGIIYYDELRTNRLGKRVKYFVDKYNAMKFNQVLPLEFVPAKTHLWWIPKSDISANSALKQNPENKQYSK